MIIRLSWQNSDNKDITGKMQLQLIDKKGEVVAASKGDKNGILYLRYKPKEKRYLWIRVLDKGIINPVNKHFSLYVQNAYTGSKYAYFNGFGVSTYRSLVESPFIISVGSFGKNDKGELLPSPFSSYNKTVDGQILPHILAPGQLLIDGKKTNGTSFASPFITAFASRMADYNIKNYIESLSSKEKLAANLKEIEKSRWGVVDLKKWTLNNYCSASNKVKNVQGGLKEDKFIISFDFWRNCMEKLDYRLLLKVKPYKNGELLHNDTLEFFSPVYKNQTKNIAKQKVTFTIPFDKLPLEYERFSLDSLQIQTRALKNSTRWVLNLYPLKKGFKNPNGLTTGSKNTNNTNLN